MKPIFPHNHADCVVCQQPFFADNTLQFTTVEPGVVRAEIVTTDRVQGYAGIMQGGLITALHDSAMLHCLFSMGITAMTAKLETRFHQPVPVGVSIVVEARWLATKRNLHQLSSQISVAGQLCSSAKSQFLSLPDTN